MNLSTQIKTHLDIIERFILTADAPDGEVSSQDALKAVRELRDILTAAPNLAAIEPFLSNHKRGCPANRGRNCKCSLYEARQVYRRLLAIYSTSDLYVQGELDKLAD